MKNDVLVEKLNDATLMAILKYRNHSCILVKQGKLIINSVFTFSHIPLEDILKEIGTLDNSKLSQEIDVLAKTTKENTDMFVSFIRESFNNMIHSSIFPAVLKLAYVTCVFKKGS